LAVIGKAHDAWRAQSTDTRTSDTDPRYPHLERPFVIRSLYSLTLRMAEHRHALWVLAFVAFIESSVFPIPPDILMIPMILAAPRRAFVIAGIATVASVLGGMFGYWIGAVLFDTIGQPILALYGQEAHFDTFAKNYNAWGAWAVLIAGVTPFPYKVVTILSGSTGLNLWVFLIASIVARGLRFFLVAALLWKFGAPIRDFIERRLGLMFTLALALLVGGFLLVKLL
jgi:membrane protein YqaA with SNARE-associated domain